MMYSAGGANRQRPRHTSASGIVAVHVSARGVGHQVRRIAGPPTLHLDLNLFACNLASGVYYFQYRIALTVAEIYCRRRIA